MERYVYIALTLALTTYGQIVIKSRAIQLTAGGDKMRYLTAMFTDPLVISGLAAAIVASVCWALAIEKTDLGLAYPFMALSFVIIPLTAALLFGDSISALQMVGLTMIVGGVAINALAR